MNRTMTMTPSVIDDILASQGRGNDTIVAHISPREAKILKKHGGSGTINPKTGMLEFFDASGGGESAGGAGGEGDTGQGDSSGESAGMGGPGESGGGVGSEGGGESAGGGNEGGSGYGGGFGGSSDGGFGGGGNEPETATTTETNPTTITLSDGRTATWDATTRQYKVDGPDTKTAAGLLRAQFEDWQATYKPIELAAINQISFNNPEVLPKAVSVARESATGYSNAMSGILGRQTRSLGQQPTGEQKTTSDRILNLNRAAMIAGAENTARSNVRTQDEQILLGAAPNPNIQKAM